MLTPYDPLCDKIRTRNDLTKKLATTPWHHLAERRDLRRRIVDLTSSISEKRVLELADEVVSEVWRLATAEIIPDKNPYGPAARARFDEILDAAFKRREVYVVHRGDCSFPLTDLPEIEGVLTRKFMAEKATRVIQERAEIAASPDLIHKYVNYQGKQALMIQHVASGLRGLFAWDAQGFGSVDSKQYTLDSIDPANPGELVVWQPVVGLGIGPRIYAEAHRLLPHVRWPLGFHTPYAASLRRRLHVADPYIWEGSCGWCNVNLPQQGVHHWMNAVPSSFNGHPR